MAAIDRIGSYDPILIARGGATLGPVQVYDDGVAVGISVPGEEWRGRAALYRDAYGNYFAHTATVNHPLNTDQRGTAVARTRDWIKGHSASGLYDVRSPDDPQIDAARSQMRNSRKYEAETDPHHGHEHVLALQNALRDFESDNSSDTALQSAVRDAKSELAHPGALATDEATYLQDFIRQAEAKLVQAGAQGHSTVMELGAATSNFDKNPGSIKARDRLNQALFDSEHAKKAKWLVDDVKQAALWEPSARKRLHPPRPKPVPPGLMGTPLSGTLITGTGIAVGAKSASGKFLQGDLVRIDGSQWGLRGKHKATPYKVPITIQDRDAAIAYCKKKIEGGGWSNLESLDPKAIKGSSGHAQAAYLKPLRDQVQVGVADIHDKELRWGEITQSKNLLNALGDRFVGDGFQLYENTRIQLNDIVMEAAKGSINLEEAKRRVRATMADFSGAHERQISQFTSNAGHGAAIAGAAQTVSNFIVTGAGNKFGGPGLGAAAGFANRTLQDFFADWVINASPLAKYYDKGVAQYVPKPGDPKRMAQNALASLADAVFLRGASVLTAGAATKLAPLLPASWLAPVASGLGFGGADLLRLPLDLLNTAVGQQFDQSALRQEIERAKTQYPEQKAEYLARLAASWEQARPAWVQKQVRSEAVRFEAHKQHELGAERALRDSQLNAAMANAEHQLQGTPPAERAAALASLRETLGERRDALVAQRAAELESQRQPFLDQTRANANQRFDSARDHDLKQRSTQLDARQKASIKTAQARLTKLKADAPGELVQQAKEKAANLVVTVPTGALFGATGNPLTQTGEYSFQLKPGSAAITTGIGGVSGGASSVLQSMFSRGELPTVDEVINGTLSGAITAIPLAGAVHGDPPAKPAPKSEPTPMVGAVEPPVLPSNPEPTPSLPTSPKTSEVLPAELKADLQLQGTNAVPFTDYQFVLAGRKVLADTPAQAVQLQRRGARYVPFADRSKSLANATQPEPVANLRADTDAWNSGLRTRSFVLEKAAAEPGGDPRAEPLRIEVASPADVLAWRQAGWSYKGLGASRTASVDAGLLDSTLAQPATRSDVLSLWQTQGQRRGIVLSNAGRQVEVSSPAAALRLERSGWTMVGLGLPHSAVDLSPLTSGVVTPRPATTLKGAEPPPQEPGALVLANPAAIAVDIPAPPGKGRDRVAAVYTQVSPDLATVLARTLQDANPNTYGQQPTADIVRDVVRLGEGDSLIVVVRDKNIAGQSPMSDSVATPETLLSPKEYQQLLNAQGADAFATARGKLRLGAAKIYNAPPASAATHIEAVKDVAGDGYGYLGQVIGANLQGSGGQAMKLTLDLARAANMKGLTLYTNAAAGFYEKLGFRTVARTNNADGTVSNHMVWDNAGYRADQPTLRLDNPAVLAALNKPVAGPQPSPALPKVDPEPTQAIIGEAPALPGVPFEQLKPSDLSFSVDGALTRFELFKDDTLGAFERKKQVLYDAGAVFWESKIEGPVIELGRSTRAKVQPSIDAAALLVQEKILLPSARVLEEKVLTPVFESAPGQQLLSVIDSASQGFKSAAFEARLRAIDFGQSDAGLVLRDLSTIARDAGLGAKDAVLNGLRTAGRQLQKSLPGVAGATLFVLSQAAARGTLRMVTVDVGAQPLVGEALMVKKALNIPNGIKFTYLIAEVPGMENVGGRAIVAYGGGDHALIQPATGPGQSGVSQPWIGQRADGSVVFTATGIAQGPNAFVGYSLGTTNLNISDLYNGQLGRAAINPVSTSAGGEPRASGRNWDFKVGPFALDLATGSHQSVLNAGPLALTFNRYRDPLSLKGGALSSENKNLVLQRRVGADGRVTYVPFIDITGKAGASDISPVVPVTGSTTFDTQAKDWVAAQKLFGQLDAFVRDLPDAPNAPALPEEPFAPLPPKRPSGGDGPRSASDGDPPASGSGGGGDVPPPNRPQPPGDLLDQAGVPQTLTPEERDVARRNKLQMSLETPPNSGAEPPPRQTRLEDLPRDRGFDPDSIAGMRAGDFAKEYLKIYNGFEANGTPYAADPALAARVYEVWKPEEALRLREIGARHDTPFEALVPFRVAAFDFARIEQLAQSGLVANNALRATEQGLERQMMSAGTYTVFNNVSLPGADGALAMLSGALPRGAGGTPAARTTFGPGAGNTPAPDAVLDATAAALRQRFPRLYGSSGDAQIIERAQLRNNQITVSVSADNEVRFTVGTPRDVSVIPPGGGGLTTARYEQALNEFAAALKRGNVTYRDNSIAEIVEGAELRSKTLFVLRDSNNPQAIATMTASLKEYGAITGLEGERFAQGTYAYLGQLTAGTGASAVPGAGTEQMSALQNVVRNSLARADVPDLQGIVLYTNNPANIKTYLDAGFSLTAVHQSAQSGKYEYYFRWAPGSNTDLQEVPMVWVQSQHGGNEPPPTVGVPLRQSQPVPANADWPVQTSTQGQPRAGETTLEENIAAAGGAAGAEFKTLSLFKDPASGLPNRLGQEFLMSFVDPATGQRRQMMASDLGLPEAKAALAQWGISEPKVLEDGRVMTVDMKRLKELLANTAIAPKYAKGVRVTTELAQPQRAGPQYTLGELWLATSWAQREFAVSHVAGSTQWSVLMGTGRMAGGTWRTAIPRSEDLILHFHPNGSAPSKPDIQVAQSGGLGGRNSLVITAARGQKIDDVTVYVFGDVPGRPAHPGTRVQTSAAPATEVRSEPADVGGAPPDPALQARIVRQATLLNPAGEPLTALPSGYQPGVPFALALEESAGLPPRVWVAEQPAGTDEQAFKSLVGAAASVPRATAERSLLLVNARLDSSGQVQAARRDGASISYAQAQAIADATQRPVLTEAIVNAVMPRSWIAKVDATGYAPSDIRGARQAWSETVLRRLVKKYGAEATPQILEAVAQRRRFPNDSLTTARVDQFMQVMLPAANNQATSRALAQLTADAGLAQGQPEADLLRSYVLNIGTLGWTEERWVQAMWMLTGDNFSAIQTRLFDRLDKRLGLKSYDDVMRYYGRLVLDAATH